jgi:succinoglycan biosynthesis transport protein ExoP
MLKRVDAMGSRRDGSSGYRPERDATDFGRPHDLELWLGIVRRQARVLLVAALAGLLIGFAYIVIAVPQYTATTEILIDSQKGQSDVSTSIAELVIDTGAIDSQVEILKSARIASSVVSSLNLASDPKFMVTHETLFRRALAMLRPAFELGRWFAGPTKLEPENELSSLSDAVLRLETNLAVRRVARTYVLAVDFTSPDPKMAADVANAFAASYLADQLDSSLEASERLTRWMQARIEQLKNDSLNSDLAVQKFKADHGLVTADGKLVSDQQLTGLTEQLMAAQSDTAKAEARFNQITAVLKSGKTDGAVTDSFDSSVLTDLQQKYLATSGSRPALAAGYQRQISEELRRIAETYHSQAELARAKEDTLKKTMMALAGENAKTNEALVQLRELERKAETYRSSYENFLQRYQAIVQRQSAPVSEGRVITPASPPSVPSYPRRSLILGLSLVLGSMAGIAIGLSREHWDRAFRTSAQVRNELGLEFLGMLQLLNRPTIPKMPGADPLDPKKIATKDSRQRYSIDHPLSRFSETLRSVKLAVDLSLLDRQSKVIGVVSALPDEGKTLVSKNFASFLARLGAATLLIDGDLRESGLTRSLVSHADAGLLEAIRRDRALGDLLFLEADSGLRVLPAVVSKRLHHPGEVLSSPGMLSLLTEARKDFDYIIVDLPPLAPVVDVAAAASVFDAFILLVEWGRTPRRTVQSILDSDKLLYDKCVGVVLNKVQINKIARYENSGSKVYYPGAYSDYYREEKEYS